MGYMYLFLFWFPQGICLGVGLLGHMVVLFLAFKGISIPSSIVVVSIYIPPTVQEHSLFSTPSLAFIVCRYFDDGHSDQCEVISHCALDLYFSNNQWCWAFFHVLLSHLKVFLGEMSVRSFPHFWIGFFVFLALSCMSCLYILEINPLSVVSLAIIFSQLRVVFSPCLWFPLLWKKPFKFNQVPLVYFCFYFCYSRRWVIEDLWFMSLSVLPLFSSKFYSFWSYF